jgi:tripartite-type tricarboxylate transporter receptor subunit TctC
MKEENWSSCFKSPVKVVLVMLVMLAIAFAAPIARSQDYPSKPIRIVVPFAPGGGTDLLARLYSQRVYETFGQTAVIENRAGAGGNIGAELVAKSQPDGYTLLFSTASLAVNVTLYPKLPYNLLKDFIPISQMATAPMVLAIHPSVNAKSVKELIQIGKARPGGINFGSNGSGTTSHLSGVIFGQIADIPVTHISYKGAGAAINGLLTGEVDIAFLAVFSAMPHIKSGKFRALAVTTKQRSPALPDVPTLDSMFPGFETDNWFGMFAPTGTPQAIVQRIHAHIVKSIQHRDLKGFIEREGGYAVGNTPAEFVEVIARDIEKYGKVVKSSGARPD